MSYSRPNQHTGKAAGCLLKDQECAWAAMMHGRNQLSADLHPGGQTGRRAAPLDASSPLKANRGRQISAKSTQQEISSFHRKECRGCVVCRRDEL